MLNMKKALVLLLAVLMLANVGCAWAEETGEAVGITFQGIPWGSTYEETVRRLVECGVLKDETYAGLEEGAWWFDVLDEHGEIIRVEKETFPDSYNPAALVSFRINSACGLVPEFTMGGYSVNALEFFFANDGTTTRLVSVMVLPLPSDTFPAMCLDLVEKLDAVYGKGTLVETRFTSTTVGHTYSRICDDHSAVYIASKEDLYFDFMYGTTDALQMLGEAFENLPSAGNNNPSANDTGGL